jgi:non-specific protein-tyrosine kinase
MYQLAALLYPRSGVAEAYRTLRTNIEFSALDAPIRTLLVTSSVPGEGKTVTAANLAVVFAQAGRRVLLVDADLRKPGVHIIFDLPNAHGLTTLLRSADVSLDAVVQSTEQDNLRILTTGPLPPNPAELAGSQRMRTVVDLLTSTEDLVIFDSPPLQAVTDAAILGSFLDATVFVIDAQRSRRRVIRPAREALAKAGANVVGAPLNRVPARANSDRSPYYGGYGRYDEGAAGPSPVPDASR